MSQAAYLIAKHIPDTLSAPCWFRSDSLVYLESFLNQTGVSTSLSLVQLAWVTAWVYMAFTSQMVLPWQPVAGPT